MRLDAQRERELEKRKGLATRTIIGLLWFGLCALLAYILADWLFANEYLTIRWFHAVLFVPWEWDDWIIVAGVVIAIVFAVNFLILVGYAFFSAVGRRRPGTASLYSADPDPDDHRYDYR
jgi:hypothetical protein